MTTNPSDTAGERASPRSSGRSRWQVVIGGLGLVVVFWVGDRLYEVIDRGSVFGDNHGPTNTPIDEESPDGPPAGGGHDPSQFDH